MRGPLDVAPAAARETELSEERVDVWGDSVGAAVWQLGVIVAVIAAVRFASDLLFGN